MCKNATKTAYNLAVAIEPTIKLLLNATGLGNTDNGIAAMKAFDALLAALQTWQSGTSAQNVLQVIADFQEVWNTLPIPTQYVSLGNIIIAGVETVIGVISANSPAPAAPAGVELHEEHQAMYAMAVAAHTTVKVQALVPGFKRSIWHSPESQYVSTWNKAVEEEGLPETLTV